MASATTQAPTLVVPTGPAASAAAPSAGGATPALGGALEAYEVVGVLGKGSFGVVSKVRRKADGRVSTGQREAIASAGR